MESKLKKMLPLAGVLCSFFSTAVYAYDQQDQRDRVREQDTDTHRPAGHIPEEHHPDHREITPSAGPRVTAGADVFITADFILWQPTMDNLAYAFTGLGDGNTSVSQGTVKRPEKEWEPGFKVGLGMQLDHDGWDLYFQYTWLRHRRSESTGFDSTLAPLWNINNNFSQLVSNQESPRTGSINSASARWKLDYNVFDLEMGRNHFVSQYLKLRPFFGLRGAWNDQEYRVTYTSPEAEAGTAEDRDTSHRMRNNQDYWAIGLRSGLNTAWHFTKEFSVYGDAAVSALWANRTVRRKDWSRPNTGADEGEETSTINFKDDKYGVQPIVEAEIGLRYQTWFSDDDYHFLVQAGWQFQNWTNFNQISANRGDLSLQGLVIKARFDF